MKAFLMTLILMTFSSQMNAGAEKTCLKQWEYLTYYYNIEDPDSLNNVGKMGWELVTIIQSNRNFYAVFKRLKNDCATGNSAGQKD